MSLVGLFPLLDELPEYGELRRRLSEGKGVQAKLPEAIKPFALTALWKGLGRTLIVITSRQETARQLFDQLCSYAGNVPEIQLLPEPDFLPYERSAPDRSTVQQRLRVLSSLAAGEAPLVVAPVYAAVARTIPPDDLRANTITVKRGEKADLMDLLRRWEAMGYQMEPSVEVAGTMSRRGGILDIYPLSNDYPVRIELFGTNIESLRLFDPGNQRSLEQVQSVIIGPAAEMLARGKSALGERLDLRGMSPEAKDKLADELRMVADGQAFEEMTFYGPLVNSATLLDYASRDAVIVLDEPALVRQALDDVVDQGKELKEELLAKKELPRNFPPFLLTAPELDKRMKAHARLLRFESFQAPGPSESRRAA